MDVEQLFSLRYTNNKMKEKPNLNYLNKISEGSQEIKIRIVNVIKEEFTIEVTEYIINMMNNNLLNASENVHKIRHKIGFLGMENAYDLSNEYEQNLKNNCTDLKNEFEITLSDMYEFIKKITL